MEIASLFLKQMWHKAFAFNISLPGFDSCLQRLLSLLSPYDFFKL
jgi:hypothetical protein